MHHPHVAFLCTVRFCSFLPFVSVVKLSVSTLRHQSTDTSPLIVRNHRHSAGHRFNSSGTYLRVNFYRRIMAVGEHQDDVES